MKPQIMKSFGAGDINRTFRLSMTAGKFGFSMMSLLSIPILITLPELLELWLGDVPEGTAYFARLMVAACMFDQLTKGLVHANQAIGNIKWFSIIVSSIRMMALPSAVVVFLCGFPAKYGMWAYAFFETAASFSRIYVMKKTSGLDVKEFHKTVYLKILPPFVVSFVVGFFVYLFLPGLLGIAAVTIICALIYCVIFYYFGLSDIEKNSIVNIVLSLKDKIKRR